MAIPALTAVGLLPEGVHAASLSEVEDAFGKETDTRAKLFANLCSFLELARSFRLFTSIVIDGSFVTNKPAPSDIDAVLILPADELRGLISREDYVRLENPTVREQFGVDLFIEPDHEGMTRFFQQLKVEDALQRGLGPRHRRGVVEVAL